MTPGLKPAQSFRIEPASAAAFELADGATMRIRDPEGSQVGDLLAFVRDDPRERFSQSRTRVYLERLVFRTGDALYSTRNRPLLTLVDDTVGVHDLLFCGCSEYVFGTFLSAPRKRGCLDNLAEALAPYGIEADAVEAPFDLFMATRVEKDGQLVIERSPSRPGDHASFRAEIDLIVGLAACADDVSDCNGGRCGPLEVEIW